MAETIFKQESLFYGTDAKKSDLSAEEFLDRVTAHLNTIEDITQIQRIDAITAQLRSQARLWWKKSAKNSRTAADYRLLQTDWQAWVQCFTKQYCKGTSISDATLNWTGFKALSGESSTTFLIRVMDAAYDFANFNKQEEEENYPAAHFQLQHTDEEDEEDDANVTHVRAAITGLNHARRTLLTRAIHDHAQRYRDTFMTRYTVMMILKVTINGMNEPRLRPILLKALLETHLIGRVIDDLLEAENTLPRKGKSASLHAIDVSDTEDQEEENLDAVKAKTNKKKKKGAPNKPKKTKPKADAAKKDKVCTFCDKTGHLEADCFTRRHAMANAKAATKTSKDAKPASFEHADAIATGQQHFHSGNY